MLELYNAIQGVLAAGLGPLTIALVSEHVFRGAGPRYAIPAVTAPPSIAAGLIAFLARKEYASARRSVVDMTT